MLAVSEHATDPGGSQEHDRDHSPNSKLPLDVLKTQLQDDFSLIIEIVQACCGNMRCVLEEHTTTPECQVSVAFTFELMVPSTLSSPHNDPDGNRIGLSTDGHFRQGPLGQAR